VLSFATAQGSRVDSIERKVASVAGRINRRTSLLKNSILVAIFNSGRMTFPVPGGKAV
jgi:hypothetical protein